MKPRNHIKSNAAITLVVAAFSILPCNAQSSFDNGGGDNLWSTSSNWDPDGAPGGTITIAGGLSATSNADVSLGSGSTVLIGYDPNGFGIGSGPGGNGALDVTAGAFTYNGGGTFGMALGGSAPQGILNINGTGTVNIQSGNMLIGWDKAGGTRGTGTVNVGTGGTLNISTTGLQAIGWGTDGFLNIAGGTVNQSNGTLRVAANGGILAGFSMSSGNLVIEQEMRVGDTFTITSGSQSGGTIEKIATQVGNFAVGVNNAPINYSHTGGDLYVEDTGGSFIFGWNSQSDLTPWGGQVYTLDGGTINVGQTSQAGVRIALGSASAIMNVKSGSLDVGASSGYGLRIGEDFGGPGNGVMNVSAGSVTVNGGGMWVGFQNGSTGVLNQTGGTVSVAPGQTLWVGNPGEPTSTGTYNLDGGILELSSLGISGVASSINFGNGTMRNNADMTTGTYMNLTGSATWDTAGYNATLLAVLSGSGGLTKIGAGTLTLNAGNTYTGDTVVNEGTLSLANAVLADAADVRLATGATLDLTFAGTDAIDELFIDNVKRANGTWGSTSSSAVNKTTLITGSGILQVGPVGGYSSWASSFTSPPLSNTASTADPDFDGLTNAMEYALGLDPRFSSGSPGVSSNGGKTISFTKGAQAKTDNKVTYQIETSTTLGVAPSPWTVATSPIVTETADTISITFPAGPAKDFARLKVTLAP